MAKVSSIGTRENSQPAHCFRTLKHLLATGACQVHSEDAYYGHLVFHYRTLF